MNCRHFGFSCLKLRMSRKFTSRKMKKVKGEKVRKVKSVKRKFLLIKDHNFFNKYFKLRSRAINRRTERKQEGWFNSVGGTESSHTHLHCHISALGRLLQMFLGKSFIQQVAGNSQQMDISLILIFLLLS